MGKGVISYTQILGLYVSVTWNVCTSISVQSCGVTPITTPLPSSPPLTTAFLPPLPSSSWEDFFSSLPLRWDWVITPGGWDTNDWVCLAPFSLFLRLLELRWGRWRDLSLRLEERRTLGRFTDSALALKPALTGKHKKYIVIKKYCNKVFRVLLRKSFQSVVIGSETKTILILMFCWPCISVQSW